jgi:hypothetical protein
VSKALTRADLNEIVHKTSAADGVIHLEARCHPEAPTYVSYVSGPGFLVLHCSICGKHIHNIALAPAYGDDMRAAKTRIPKSMVAK